eukprot:Clim_evm43s214 gene=Clim_evmTU43s214
MPAAACWRRLTEVKPCELRLNTTLLCGQAFRWKVQKGLTNGDAVYTGVIEDRLIKLREDEEGIFFWECGRRKIKNKSNSCSPEFGRESLSTESLLRDYFQLDTQLQPLYAQWSLVDPRFKVLGLVFPGTRVLRQDPLECLFSFICSSNNNIARISDMVTKLCKEYGDLIGTDASDGQEWYAFPKITQLTGDDIEQRLRDLGFGYRAKFIVQSARQLNERGGIPWLYSLRDEMTHGEAKDHLMQLHGIGAKVADCICLMSLDKTSAVPIDVHVWRFARNYYLIDKKDLQDLGQARTLTPRVYNAICGRFTDLHGEHAGWAHTILFCGELGMFKERVKAAAGDGDEKIAHKIRNTTGAKKRQRKKQSPKSMVDQSTKNEQQQQRLSGHYRTSTKRAHDTTERTAAVRGKSRKTNAKAEDPWLERKEESMAPTVQ